MLDIFNLTSEEAQLLNSIQLPQDIFSKSLAYRFWFRSLLHKIDSSIVFNNLPEGWSNDYFMFCLWVRGYVAVFETYRKDLIKYGNVGEEDRGVLFSGCQVTGRDFYYQPTDCTLFNPVYIPKRPLKIGEECCILKLTPDFFGVLDIIDYYAEKLAEMSKGIDMSIINTKYALVFTADNEAQAATLKAVVDAIQSGSPVAFYKDTQKSEFEEVMPRKEPFEVFNQEITKNYILDKQLADLDHILNQFYTEIGLPVAIDKKERLVTAEAEFSMAQSQARIACWMETLKESLEIINKKYNTNIEVICHVSENNADRDGEGASEDRKKYS